MKLVFNRQTCDGHGRCLEAAPSLMAWGTDGKARLVKAELETQKEIVEAEDACMACPTQSLDIVK